MLDRNELHKKKQIWLGLFASFVMLVLMVSVVASNRSRVPDNVTKTALNVLAIGSLACASGYAQLMLRPKRLLGEQPEPLAPDVLQTRTLIALSIGEMCALLGFVLAFQGLTGSVWPYAAGTLLVYFLVILPLGLLNWRLLEAESQ
jgi:hypothetical protein